MAPKQHSRALLSVFLSAAALLATGVVDAAAAPGPTCAKFSTQAEAQDSFAEFGGSPRHPVGRLDEDRDGIACEGRPAPHAGYATLGYNRKGAFLYGAVAMPRARRGDAAFPCLAGNHKGPLGPRRLRVYRARVGADRPILGAVGAEARPEDGRLLWRAERASLAPGRYYVAFEPAMRLSPYGPNPCPGFRSREVTLPAPLQAAS